MKPTPDASQSQTSRHHCQSKGRLARPGDRPRYVPPQVFSYSNEEILEQLGPAQAQGPSTKRPEHGFDIGLPGGD